MQADEENTVNQQVIKITAHKRPVYHAYFSVDGQFVYSGGQDSYFHKFCAYTGKLLESYGPHMTQTAISCFSVTSDNKYAILGFNAEKIIVHDLENKQKEFKTVDIKQWGTRFIQVTKNSKYVFAGTTRGGSTCGPEIIKYEFPSMNVVQTIPLDKIFNIACLSPDDKQLWLGCDDGIRVLSTENLSILHEEEMDAVFDITVYKDAFMAIPIRDQSLVYFYSIQTFEDVTSVKVDNKVNTAIVNEKNGILVIGGGLDPKRVANSRENNNTLTQFYDLAFKRLVFEQRVHDAPTHRLRFSPDCLALISASEDGTLSLQRFDHRFLDYKFQPQYLASE